MSSGFPVTAPSASTFCATVGRGNIRVSVFPGSLACIIFVQLPAAMYWSLVLAPSPTSPPALYVSPLSPNSSSSYYFLLFDSLSLALSIALKFSRERSNNYPLRSVQWATQYTPSPHLTSHTHLAARLAYSNNKRPASYLIPRYPRTGSSSWPDQYVIRLNMQTCKNEW